VVCLLVIETDVKGSTLALPQGIRTTGVMVCWRVLVHLLYHTFRCVCKIVKCDCWLCHVCLSLCLSTWSSAAPTWWIFMKFYIGVFFENLLRKFKFHKNWTRIMGALLVDKYTFLIISRSVLLRMRNVSDKNCRENQNTHFIFNNFFLMMPFMR
jgi:hypothetical protein